MTQWCNLSAEAALEELNADADKGLETGTAKERLQQHGPNELQEAGQVSAAILLARQLKNPLLVILLIGAGVSLYADHPVDAIAIAVIVVINALIGFAQEFKAQKSIAALKEMAAPQAMTLRDGDWTTIPASELVPGDIIKLDTGDVIPADLRVLSISRITFR